MADLKDEVESFVGKVKHEFTFTWVIENFTVTTEEIESKEFSLDPMCSSTWNIILKNAVCDDSSMVVGIKRSDARAHMVTLDCIFDLRNSKGTLFVRRKLKDLFLYKDDFKFSLAKFYKPSKLGSVPQDMRSRFMLCSDDKLIVEGKIATVSCCHDNEPMKGNVTDLQRDLVVAFRENLFADVNFIIGEDTIPAHKFILVARSSVFRRMFEVNMKENTDNIINITDIEKPVLEDFLLFLYSGVIHDYSENMITELYSVADKYEVRSLQDTCRQSLISCLSKETACTIINLASIYNDEKLQNTAFTYLCENFVVVESTEHWKKFAEHNPTLAAKAVCKFASTLRRK